MATPAFFNKELPEQPIYVQGRGLKFEFMATEDDFLIGELRNAVRGGYGGVIEITREQYDEGVKKKENSKNSSQPFQRRAEITPQWSQPTAAARPAVVLGNRQPPANLPPAEPISIPSPKVFLPKVGKLE
jgi:hypothetical protein